MSAIRFNEELVYVRALPPVVNFAYVQNDTGVYGKSKVPRSLGFAEGICKGALLEPVICDH